MKRYRAPSGEDRLWFDTDEIETIVEREVNRAAMMPTLSEPAIDLERFIERHLGASLDQYAELDAGTLGLTQFFQGKPPHICINKDLTGCAVDDGISPPGIRGRWRATLAHEAGHVVLHRSLFEFAAGTLDLFDVNTESDTTAPSLQRCLKPNLSYRGVSDWREFQANQAMAALLMPRSFFLQVARIEIGAAFPDHDRVPAGSEVRIAAALAERLDVSKQAARIRLETLGLVDPPGQAKL